MRENSQALTVVHEWVAKADNDLKTAVHTLKLGEECPTTRSASMPSNA